MCFNEGGSKQKCWCGIIKVGRPAPLGYFAMWAWHLPSGMHCEQVVVLGAPEQGRLTSLSPQFQRVHTPGAMP